MFRDGELALLAWIGDSLAPGATGDDAALFPTDDGYFVASCDMFVEGKHFLVGTRFMATEDIGWRAMALALGDLAAKGARPLGALTAIAMPNRMGWARKDLATLYRGMAALGRRFKMRIVGGDMSATEGPIVLSITVIGHTKTRPIARAKAKPGWSIGVTGPLGAAAVALRKRRAYRLLPLIDEGRRLNELGLCCGDISDGLVREMEKFAAMSGTGSVIDAERVPRAEGASLEEALTSGEEAQLVCVGPRRLVAKSGLHVVGEMIPEKVVNVSGARLRSTGYDHFGRAGN